MSSTILLVDDHPDTLEFYAFALGDAGFDVVTAANGREALNALATHDIAIVVTDVAMPDIDGIELCQRIRATPQGRSLPILALTGQPRDQALVDVAAGGACALCLKPLTADGLVYAVQALLAEGPRCYCCWENPDAFHAVGFGEARGWMRHQPLEPQQ